MKTLIRPIPFFCTLVVLNSLSGATAEELPGQKVEDNKGSVFMEEVIDSEKFKQEELQRNKKSTLERSRPTDAQLQNVGVQVTPSGSIIPLINRGAPPVKDMGTTFTSSFEPMYPGYVVVPANPLMPQNGIPYGGIAPYAHGVYGPGVILNNPGYSYTWQSTPGAPAAPPASVTTEGTIRTNGFLGGFAGRSPAGGFQAGGVLGLPTTTQFSSTTTITPIPPSTPSEPK